MTVTAPAATNPFAVLATDVKAFIAKVKAGLQWFGTEAEAGIAWVDKEVPGAQQAMAVLFQEADIAMVDLEGIAKTGLSGIVSSTLDESETFVAGILSGLGTSPQALMAKATLSAIDVAAVNTAKNIAQGAVNASFAKILGTTAAVAAAAQTANGTVAQPAQTAAPAPQQAG